MIIVDTEKMAQGKAGIHSSRSNSFKGMAEESAIPMVTACDVPEPEVTTKATTENVNNFETHFIII
jgi:hypothetical protein